MRVCSCKFICQNRFWLAFLVMNLVRYLCMIRFQFRLYLRLWIFSLHWFLFWLRLLHYNLVVDYVLFELHLSIPWFFQLFQYLIVVWQAEPRFLQSWNTRIVEHYTVHSFKDLIFSKFEPFVHLIVGFLDVCPRWSFRRFGDLSCNLIYFIIGRFQKDESKILTHNFLHLKG